MKIQDKRNGEKWYFSKAMKKHFDSVNFLVIILFYFVPLILWSWYSTTLMSPVATWLTLSSGLIVISFCSLFLYLYLNKTVMPPAEMEKEFVPLKEMFEAPKADYAEERDLLESENKELKNQIEGLRKDLSSQMNSHEDHLSMQMDLKNKEVAALKNHADELEKNSLAKDKTIEELTRRIDELDYELKTVIECNKRDFEDENNPYHQESNAFVKGEELALKAGLINEVKESGSRLQTIDLSSLEKLINNQVQGAAFVFDPQEERILWANGKGQINPQTLINQFQEYIEKNAGWKSLKGGKSTSILLPSGHHVLLSPILEGPYKNLSLGLVF